MQVIETNADGLKREYQVTIDAAAIDERLQSRLEQMKNTVRMKGFRPGKVPLALLRRMYGEPLRHEVRMELIEQTSRSALEERALRPAMQPRIEVVKGGAEGEDLEYRMDVEILPEINDVDLSELELEREVAEVDEAMLDEALENLARQQRSFAPKAEGEAAENGDAVVIDFEGRRDGVPLEQARAEDFEIVLGSGRFIPGFEEQLIGAKGGETRVVTVTFPEDYPAKDMAGAEVAFDVTVKEVKAPQPVAVDEDLAKRLGLDTLDALRAAVRERIAQDHEAASRAKLKRRLLDALDERFRFEVPPGMVQAEFAQIWSQVTGRPPEHDHDHDHDHAHDHDHDHAHDQGPPIEAAEGAPQEDAAQSDTEAEIGSEAGEEAVGPEDRAEYERIAERRVRLGLLLAEIGRRQNVTVPQEDVSRALGEYARRFPGREQEVFRQIANNPQALAHIRAPLYEERVIDAILDQARITEKPVQREELFRDPDAEEGAGEAERKGEGAEATASGGEAPKETPETPEETRE
jgi:trigger factor